MEIVVTRNNIFDIITEEGKKLNVKEKKLQFVKEQLLKLSLTNIRGRRKFKRRLMKINKQYGLFDSELADRFINWLFTIKYSKNVEKLNNCLYLYSDEEIEMFCTKERIAFLDKVKVVRRLEGK